MKVFARAAICTALLTAIAAPALAQQTVQSCGGLLCDIGLLGHKIQTGPNGEPPTQAQIAAANASDPHYLPCNDFVCRAFGGKSAEAAPPPPPPVAAAEPEPAKPKATRKKKRHVAKAEPAAAAAAPTCQPTTRTVIEPTMLPKTARSLTSRTFPCGSDGRAGHTPSRRIRRHQG